MFAVALLLERLHRLALLYYDAEARVWSPVPGCPLLDFLVLGGGQTEFLVWLV
ncbi:hypothetical protein KDW_33360 [Dictyobacter vulcani]|uniref:Uncharacterized protein n=1 Tax=Dictyobacter vulcani TaxID=2607529 RepID=A0A5J4KI60_9CHLR|nr:hypothetical protein KDW_33360 [Dictyobacter vulcani]